MAGRVPAIHPATGAGADGRVEPGHDKEPGWPIRRHDVWERFRGATRSGRSQTALQNRKQTLDRLVQLLQLHRLVEMYTALARDIAQRAGRYVTGQNDERNLAMQRFL